MSDIYTELESAISSTVLFHIHKVIKGDKKYIQSPVAHLIYKNDIVDYAEELRNKDAFNSQLNIFYKVFIKKTKKNYSKIQFLKIFLLYFMKADRVRMMSDAETKSLMQDILNKSIIKYAAELELLDETLFLNVDIDNILLDRLNEKFHKIIKEQGRKQCYAYLYPEDGVVSLMQYKALEQKYEKEVARLKNENKKLRRMMDKMKKQEDYVSVASDVSSIIKSEISSNASFLEKK